MSNAPGRTNSPKSVVFFGSRCEFSRRAVSTIRERGVRLGAVVLPGPPGQSTPIRRSNWAAVNNLTQPRTGTSLPLRSSRIDSDIPVFEVARLSDPLTIETLSSFGAAVFALSCFPRRLPRSIIQLPDHGALNAHPSLLPDNRGPDPLFWTYHRGDRLTGVTVHLVDEGFDSGAIVCQRSISVTSGIPGNFLWDRLATLGADMLADAVQRALLGTLQSSPQDAQLATYYTWPRPSDLLMPLDQWDAHRAYHFCVGVLPFGYRPCVWLNDRMYEVVEVHGTGETRDAADLDHGTSLACRDGALRVLLRSPQ
jgi:methionyl-tRNA formyltransferase